MVRRRIRGGGRRRAARRPRGGWARRALDIALAGSVLLLFVLAAVWLDRSATVSRTGTPRFVDGDSLELDGERLRIRGIDAPELGQFCSLDGADYPCGRRALASLRNIVGADAVRCSGSEHDRYDRLLVRCEAGGRDLGFTQVEAGWALAFGGYEDAERSARTARRGLWAGTFETPSDWRARKGDAGEVPHDWLNRALGWLRRIWGLSDGPARDISSE